MCGPTHSLHLARLSLLGNNGHARLKWVLWRRLVARTRPAAEPCPVRPANDLRTFDELSHEAARHIDILGLLDPVI
jgi:hypothetical protein